MSAPSIPKVILAAVDYSEQSQRALRAAMDLAKQVNARVVLLFAWAAPYAQTPIGSIATPTERDNLFEFVRKECEDTMIEFVRQVEEDAQGVDVSWIIVSGEPSHVILEQAKAQEAELIVVGSHGRTGATRWFLGSVAESVLRHSDCPVLVVPPHERELTSEFAS